MYYILYTPAINKPNQNENKIQNISHDRSTTINHCAPESTKNPHKPDTLQKNQKIIPYIDIDIVGNDDDPPNVKFVNTKIKKKKKTCYRTL